MKLYPTIGLETHAELLTESKLFCSCSAKFGGAENEHCCIGCSGFPGAMPSLNKKALELSIRAGFALGCDITTHTGWERKNYFYPDLPAAYQVSQLEAPICTGGGLEVANTSKEIDLDPTETRFIRINNIHLEEDAGKLTHKNDKSLADYNRTGVPLIEIVTEPDFHSSDEVVEYITKLRQILQYTDICDGRMEQGSLRCDVNISLATLEDTRNGKLGVRTEIKNLNSIKAIARAIAAEIDRQTDAINDGIPLKQQTLRYDDSKGETYPMRTKEDAHDYRYYPDPDIPMVLITKEELEHLKSELPILPSERAKIYGDKYNINPKNVDTLLADKNIADFFEETLKTYNSPKTISNLIIGELLRRVNSGEADILNLPFSAKDFALLQKNIDDGKINRDMGKDIIKLMLETGDNFEKICDDKNLWIKEDLEKVAAVIDKVISENPKAVEQYKNGEMKVFGFLMGQANKVLKGSVSTMSIKNTLENKLK